MFVKLKETFLSAPVIKMPDTTKPFFVMTDASLTASEGVLMQKDLNGDFHPCAYHSATFSPAERNYNIYDRELLAVIQALKEWQHYCCTRSARHGTLFPFSVLTLNLRPCANGRCCAVQARLCHKCCGHIIGLGPYLLSMTSSLFALVAVMGFSSFHFCFAPLISAPFAIRRWLPFTQLLFCHWTITLA